MTTQPAAPLTIIAIFAGIIESSALATLPFLSDESQTLYTWFLVGFPFFLTALFFLTLNFNYKSLYKPEEIKDVNEATRATASNFKPTSTAKAEPITVMLSGPDVQKMITQQLLHVMENPHESGQAWLFCNLENQQCFRLSIGDLADNAQELSAKKNPT
ncbi:hypothetical protein ACU5P1_20125 [Pseudomonas plecoglossicida]|uniref:Uncharacterized protein n=1 Tax=Pseudomonas plecoglossicida TaxID=70775 RepID=A0AAD0QV31_PSEDL|nr:hypothetical protein [Pseudomonas plecoglossicida]AXM96158.1 hypothetical protein DVB73_10385 [Pseudomonas plecoglossicida]EPB93421.1 hypothetical protein L321_24741 [Pseudomonas plecoglossicida NB2011]QLB56913.1 hypothetical protein HAV28_19920 [Pseudomonas plecoglossicida]GLR39261.1 hypothetical protein GCM10011247_46600 [Pseudomonas plecoglossicida]